jgi:hypothetical protein
MRVFGQSVVVLCLAGGLLAQAQGTPSGSAPQGTPAERAERILAAARVAMGGAKLEAVKSFVVKGRTRRLQGNNLLPIEFEISSELPDKYVRKDETPATESDPTSRGFNGDKLIQIPPPATPPPGAGPAAGGRTAGPAPASGGAGRAAVPPPAGADAGGRGGMPPGAPGAAGPGPGRAAGPPVAPPSPTTSVKQDFARLTLGMFAQSFSSYPLTFTYVGQGEAPQGKADVIEAKGAPNFTVRLFVHSVTHLPIMISWTTPATPAQIIILTPGQARPANPPPGARIVDGPAVPADTASQEEKDKYVKAVADLRREQMAKPIDNWIFYMDYRNTEGPMLPYKIRRAVGSDTTEETTVDAYQINPKINPKKFEPVK